MKTNRTKRLLSVLLSVALLLSFVPLTVNAIIPEIDDIEVTITLPRAGEQTNAVTVVSGEPEKYTVTVDGVWKDGGGNEAYEFISGNEYAAYFSITPVSGYALTANTTITVNGEALEEFYYLGGNEISAIQFEYICSPVLEGTINAIALTNVPTGEIGTTAAPYSYTGTDFSATGVWEYYDYTDNSYKMMAATDTFADGKLYRLSLSVEPKVGYELSYDCTLTVNGEMRSDFFPGQRYGSCAIAVSYVEQIDRIDISKASLPEAKLGETFGGTVNIALPEGSNYTASGYWCTYVDMGEVTSGTFEKGKEYYFNIIVIPKEGYAFSEYVGMWVDGEHTWMGMSGVTEAQTSWRVSFATVISRAEFLDLPVAKLGEKLQVGSFAVSVPAGVNYTAEACWFVYDEQMHGWMAIDEADGSNTVQAGKKYSLDVWAYPKDGYEFAEELILKVYGTDRKVSSDQHNRLYYYEEFSFRKNIDKVQVNGFVQPEVGKDATVDGLKVPADADYVIDHAMWFDTAGYVPATKFEAGHDYQLEIMLTPKAGYEFARKAQVLVNGEALTEQVDIYGEEVYIYIDCSFKEVIPQVQLEDLPQMQVGQTAKTEVKLPAGAKYTAEVHWRVWNDVIEGYEPFEGTFAAGKVYGLAVVLIPNEGYRFTEDGTKCLIDGQERDDFQVFGEMAVYEKEFETDQKLITRVELKVEKPVADHHASIDPTVTVVSGTGVKLGKLRGSAQWIEGDLEKNFSVEGLFTVDGEYGVNLVLVAEAGYRFADDLVVVVNGVTLPKDAVAARYKTVNAVYFFNMKNAPAVNGSDNQGDSTAVFLWASMMVLSLAAFSTCVLTKKRRTVR